MGKVIVTGGAGYIGSHTAVELAAAGHVPVLVDDLRNSEARVLDGLAKLIGSRPTCHRVDCTDRQALDAVFRAEGPVDGVVHFAADKAVGESVHDPLKYYANNVGSLVALLQVMRDHAVRTLVFSSSCTVYGQPDQLPVGEDAPDDNALSPYGSTKVIGERILRDLVASEPAWRVVLLRYFNPIGAHPSALIGELPLGVPNNLVPFATQVAAGLRDRLVIHGTDYPTPDGSCIRDYIHVVDLAQAHVKALAWAKARQEATCEVFNLGTGRGSSVLEVVRGLEAVTGRPLPHTLGPRRAGDVPEVYADPRKAVSVLGWKAERTLQEALADAWRWQRTLPASDRS
ncbi:MAG: UDP-glucose 4-epimerase GalE [Flavobacteriales bacterium]|nr:UDP-glucose 4-epimerase GalE [Flavobacteriales bacterium]